MSTARARPIAHVIVPAHDEAATIAATLRTLLAEAAEGEFDVVVVANACADATAEIARSFGPPVRVVETPVGGKAHALRLGEAEVSGFPRLYVDADVALPTATARRIAAALAAGAEAASCGLELDEAGASRAVRSYHRIWRRLPSVRDSVAGRGVYGLSARGRDRFGAFPDVLADDQFVNSVVPAAARRCVDGPGSVVRLPATVRALLARKARVHAGNAALAAGGTPDSRSATAWLGVVASQPSLALDVPVYVAVTLLAKWRARRPDLGWGRDDTARAVAA